MDNHRLAQYFEHYGFQPHNAEELMNPASYDPSKTQDHTERTPTQYLAHIAHISAECRSLRLANEALHNKRTTIGQRALRIVCCFSVAYCVTHIIWSLLTCG